MPYDQLIVAITTISPVSSSFPRRAQNVAGSRQDDLGKLQTSTFPRALLLSL